MCVEYTGGAPHALIHRAYLFFFKFKDNVREFEMETSMLMRGSTPPNALCLFLSVFCLSVCLSLPWVQNISRLET